MKKKKNTENTVAVIMPTRRVLALQMMSAGYKCQPYRVNPYAWIDTLTVRPITPFTQIVSGG